MSRGRSQWADDRRGTLGALHARDPGSFVLQTWKRNPVRSLITVAEFGSAVSRTALLRSSKNFSNLILLGGPRPAPDAFQPHRSIQK
jgi:hypothetical protein